MFDVLAALETEYPLCQPPLQKTMLARIAVKQSRTFVTRTAPKRGGDGVHYVFNTKEKRFSAATSIAVIGGGCLFGTVSALVVMLFFFSKYR